MTTDHRTPLGRAGEALASAHLERRGYVIVERNYRTRWGELDVIAYDGADTLVFCEVKTRRTSGRAVTPLESVHHRKRLQVRRMAGQWLVERQDRPRARNLRFDAIGVILDHAGHLLELTHLEEAF